MEREFVPALGCWPAADLHFVRPMHDHCLGSGGSLNRRRRRAHLRWAERIVANSCRLYLTRPRTTQDAHELLAIARSLLQLSLVFLFDAWRISGPGHLRGVWPADLVLTAVEDDGAIVRVWGQVVWRRTVDGVDQDRPETFRMDWRLPRPVPRYRRLPGPVVALGVSEHRTA